MLKKVIVCANLGLTISQEASGTLNLGSPPQVDCFGDEIMCSGRPCGTWECGLVGEPGHQQKVCFGRCSLTGLPSGSRECSCMKQLGPIQIGTPCEWKEKSAPTCKNYPNSSIYSSSQPNPRVRGPIMGNVRSFRQSTEEDPTTTSGSTTTSWSTSSSSSSSSSTTSTTTTTTTTTTTSTTTTSTSTSMSTSSSSSSTTSTTHKMNNVCEQLPSHHKWECSNSKLEHRTVCKLMCGNRKHKNKCHCSRSGRCNWSSQKVPRCIKTKESAPSRANSQMANDFMALSETNTYQSKNLPNMLIGAIQYEEEFEHEADELESAVRKEPTDKELSKIDSIFGFMRVMMEFNSNLYHKMLGVVTHMVE